MTIQEVIEDVLAVLPDAGTYSNSKMTRWINEVEGAIQLDVMLLAYDSMVQYNYDNDSGKELLVKPPHDKIYTSYLRAMIHQARFEAERYNSMMELYNTQLREYVSWYVRTYNPANGEAIFNGYYIKGDPVLYQDFYAHMAEYTEFLSNLNSAIGLNAEYATKQSRLLINRSTGGDIPLIIAHTENPANQANAPAIQIYGYIEDKGTLQQALINILNTITSECSHSVTGVNVVHTVEDSNQSHVGVMSTTVLKGASSAVQYGANFNIANITNYAESTVDQEMVGCEIDIWNKYPVGEKHKVALSVVAVGGGVTEDGVGVHSMYSKNGDGTLTSGNFKNAVQVHPNAISNTDGVGFLVNSVHGTGFKIVKESKLYGLSLVPDAGNGIAGIYINDKYNVAMIIQPNKMIKVNNTANPQGLYYWAANQTLVFNAPKIGVEGHTSQTGGAVPAECAGYITLNVNGTDYKVPYFPI
jgi:hypothetical protein